MKLKKKKNQRLETPEEMIFIRPRHNHKHNSTQYL